MGVDEFKPSRPRGLDDRSSSVPDGWVGTTIAFELRAEGSETLLALAHRGFEQANEGNARVTIGWGYFFESLQLYLETGKGTLR